jgi:pimeloyl-ACP methyl ester carboxylesterase
VVQTGRDRLTGRKPRCAGPHGGLSKAGLTERKPRRAGLKFLAALCAATVAFAAAADAAPKKRKRELRGELVEIQTQDGWTLSARYLPSREEDQLTFVLLHESRGRKQNWYWLARQMARRGIGYMAIDLRGHGLSQNPPEGEEASYRKFRIQRGDNPWDRMRSDIDAAVAFLVEREVPIEAIALGGAEVGGSLALKYAALHPDVPMVFMISPGMSYKEVLTVNAMRAYRDRPILLAVAEDDRRSATETPILYEFAKRSAGDLNTTMLNAERGHGTRMLYYSRGIIPQILDWIDDPVKAPDIGVSSDTFSGIDPDRATDDGLPNDENLADIVGGAGSN